VQEEKREYSLNQQAYIDDILKRKEEAITELYLTGRYKGTYMGIKAKSKANPIKGYIIRKFQERGWNSERIDAVMDDYYNEVFLEVAKIKINKWPDLLSIPVKMTATICLMAERNLFRVVNERYPKPKGFLEKNKLFSSQFNKEIKIVNHTEIFENECEMILEDDSVTGFEKKHSINVDDFIELMTEEQKELFYSYIEKKGTGKKGRFNNADRAKYNEILEQVTRDCKDILKKLNS